MQKTNFGAGFFIASLWNYTNLFVTTFVKGGMIELGLLLRTGHLHRPDLLVAVVAAGEYFLMLITCYAGWVRMRPKLRETCEFLAGGVMAVAYFVVIILTAGPQYIPLLKRVFHVG